MFWWEPYYISRPFPPIVLICQIMRYVGQSFTKTFSGGSPSPSKKKSVSKYLLIHASLISFLGTTTFGAKKKTHPPPLLALHLFYN